MVINNYNNKKYIEITNDETIFCFSMFNSKLLYFSL